MDKIFICLNAISCKHYWFSCELVLLCIVLRVIRSEVVYLLVTTPCSVVFVLVRNSYTYQYEFWECT